MSEVIDLLKRKKAILKARDRLIDFACYMMPVPDTPDDVSVSLYRPARHHLVLGAALEEVESGAILPASSRPRCRPDIGKTKLSQRHLFPGVVHRAANPEKIDHRRDLHARSSRGTAGRAVRDLIESSPLHACQVFPRVRLKPGSASQERLETEQGGVLFFLGRGSGATGRGADVILLDDPTKDRKEADSPNDPARICGSGTRRCFKLV